MAECYIAVRSVTYAQKLVRVLQVYGIRAKATKSPKEIGANGCGHAVYVKNGDPQKLRILIETEDFPMFRIYTTTDHVNYREYISL